MAEPKHVGFKAAAKAAGGGEKGNRIIGAALEKARHNPAAVKHNPHLLNEPHGHKYSAHGEHAKLAAEHSHKPHGSK